MKTKENITIYQCEYCKKVYQIKHFCESHELKCTKNPDNFMACIDCAHAIKRIMYYIKWIPCFVNGETEEAATIKAFWCNKKNHWIYPATRVSNPISREDIDDEIENKPMLNKCDLHLKISE